MAQDRTTSFECLIYDMDFPTMTARFQMPQGFPVAGGVYEIRRVRTATDADRARWAHLPDPEDVGL